MLYSNGGASLSGRQTALRRIRDLTHDREDIR
jgi:hypothetical protein